MTVFFNQKSLLLHCFTKHEPPPFPKVDLPQHTENAVNTLGDNVRLIVNNGNHVVHQVVVLDNAVNMLGVNVRL